MRSDVLPVAEADGLRPNDSNCRERKKAGLHEFRNFRIQDKKYKGLVREPVRRFLKQTFDKIMNERSSR